MDTIKICFLLSLVAFTTGFQIDFSCYNCLCKSLTECSQNIGCKKTDPDDICGPYLISRSYWKDSEFVPENRGAFYRNFVSCTTNASCAELVIQKYIDRHVVDCDNNSVIDCFDVGGIHILGDYCINSQRRDESIYLQKFNACITMVGSSNETSSDNPVERNVNTQDTIRPTTEVPRSPPEEAHVPETSEMASNASVTLGDAEITTVQSSSSPELQTKETDSLRSQERQITSQSPPSDEAQTSENDADSTSNQELSFVTEALPQRLDRNQISGTETEPTTSKQEDVTEKPVAIGEGFPLNNVTVFGIRIDDACTQCICKMAKCNMSAGCWNSSTAAVGLLCGPFALSKPYWLDAGAPGDDGQHDAFERCAIDYSCSRWTISLYSFKYRRDCTGEGRMDCDDIARMHLMGPYGCADPKVTSIQKYIDFKSCFGQSV